jgi:predicted XRE-type DNA-binding protein
MNEDFEVVHGSGNLFADLGDADDGTRQLKAQLAAAIIATLDAQALSVRAGARLAKIDPADLQRIRNADLSRFTLDRLIRIAHRLGRRVEMRVAPMRKRKAA